MIVQFKPRKVPHSGMCLCLSTSAHYLCPHRRKVFCSLARNFVFFALLRSRQTNLCLSPLCLFNTWKKPAVWVHCSAADWNEPQARRQLASEIVQLYELRLIFFKLCSPAVVGNVSDLKYVVPQSSILEWCLFSLSILPISIIYVDIMFMLAINTVKCPCSQVFTGQTRMKFLKWFLLRQKRSNTGRLLSSTRSEYIKPDVWLWFVKQVGQIGTWSSTFQALYKEAFYQKSTIV